jgi:hypothetical protein
MSVTDEAHTIEKATDSGESWPCGRSSRLPRCPTYNEGWTSPMSMLPRGGLNVRQVQLRKIMIGSWLEGCGRGRPRRCVCMLRVGVAQADGSGRSQAGAEHGGGRERWDAEEQIQTLVEGFHHPVSCCTAKFAVGIMYHTPKYCQVLKKVLWYIAKTPRTQRSRGFIDGIYTPTPYGGLSKQY